jgi:hypothetical protein
MKYNMDADSVSDTMDYEVRRCHRLKDPCTVTLKWMSPNDYMSMVSDQVGVGRCDYAPEEWFDKGSIADLTNKMSEGSPLDPLYINLTDRTIHPSNLTDEYVCTHSHEGRHRAFVARKLGIELVPVIVISDRTALERCRRLGQ